MQKGFTLIETLVVISITAIIATFMIANFSRQSFSLDQVVNIFIADLRAAQSKTLASLRHNNMFACGYGIYQGDQGENNLNSNYSTYFISQTSCNGNKNYNPSTDSWVETKKLPGNIVFNGTFDDIFFEPPDPKTYINNDSSLSANPEMIVISKTGATCAYPSPPYVTPPAPIANCKLILMYTSGKIDVY